MWEWVPTIDEGAVRTPSMARSLHEVVGARQLFIVAAGGLLVLYGVLGVMGITVPTSIVVGVGLVVLFVVGVVLGELHGAAQSRRM